MPHRLLFLLSAVVLFGCATEQRLGESRIESRRYSRGYHVQHHRDVHPAPARRVVPVDGRADVQAGRESMESAYAPESKPLEEIHALEGTGLSASTPDAPVRMRMESIEVLPVSEVPNGTRAFLLSSEELPDPVAGRHPNAVPGFILSLGWALGIIGEAVVNYLGMPISGFPIALGIAASIAGYILSRKAYNVSLEHPELYPRYRLARAARFVSFSFLAPVLLYVGIVLIVLLAIGGLGLF